MRICQLSHVETTFNFLTPLFEMLAAEGHDVVAASNMDHNGRVLQHHLGTAYEFHPIQVSRKVTPQTFTTEIIDLARYFARERFDVVHLHGPLAAIQGRLAARIATVPCVVNHAHGFYFHDGTAPLSRAVHATVERWVTRHLTDHLVTVNSEDLAFARHRGFTRDIARIVPTSGVGIDTERFAPSISLGKAMRSELGIPDDDTVIVFVGRLVTEKGVLDLVNAFTGLHTERPAWLLLVGEVSPTERDQTVLDRIRRLSQQAPDAAARMRLLGQRRDVPEILAAADLVVQPSYREGMPVALLEAMATAVPVITTDVRGCREAVAGGSAGVLVPPGDPDSLGTAIQDLVAYPDERARLARLGRIRVEEQYSTSTAIAPLRALYRRIESSQGSSSRGIGPRIKTVARRVVPAVVRSRAGHLPPWRITVEHVTDPMDPLTSTSRPVFTDSELERLGIAMIADPFAIRRDGGWHLYFEQVRAGESCGEIGLATSDDLSSWTYRGVVLQETFHVSYPQIMEVDGEILMVPETGADSSVRLYRAVDFPTRWVLDRVLLSGMAYKDSTILEHEGQYYLFSETSDRHTHDRLHLYIAPSVRGPWREHPAGPIVLGDPGLARPAGKLVRSGGRMVRLAQACEKVYGGGVRGRALLTLTPDEYRESTEGPDLRLPGGCLHHLDAHPLMNGWIRFTDRHG